MFSEYWNFVVSKGGEILRSVMEYLPTLLTGLIIIAVTILLAKLLKKISVKIFRAVGMNVLSKRTGIDEYIKPTQLAGNVSELLGLIIYWIVLFLGIIFALRVLGFEAAEVLLTSLLLYIPRIFIALIIFAIGSYLAGFLGNLAEKAAAGARISHSKFIGLLVKGGVFLVTGVSVIEQLTVSLEFIRMFVYLLLASILLVMTVIVGIGGIGYGKDLIGGIILKNHVKQEDVITWNGEEAKIVKISWFYTEINQLDKVVYVPNSELHKNLVVNNKSMI